MGLEKIQNLPDASSESAAGVLVKTIATLLSITMLACWAATQYAAWKLAFQPALGEPLLSFQSWKLYVPYDFFVWLLRYGHVEGTDAAWTGGEWIIASLHFLFVPAVWLAVARAKRLNKKTDTHGSARWAVLEDIYETTLLQRPPTVVQSVFSSVLPDDPPDWLRWTKRLTGPKGHSGGCYVGAWVHPKHGSYHYLTHDGPEHILAFAPTRSGKGVSLVLPTLLSWRHSSIVHDMKGEAWALTAGYRKAIGHKVLKFEPTASDGSSARFNPFEEIRVGTMEEVADTQNVAQLIVDPDGKGMDNHWAKTGHDLLTGAILHLMYVGRSKTPTGLVSFFCDPAMNIEQVAESMLNCEHDPTGSMGWIDNNTGRPTKVHPTVAQSARSFLNKSENERSGVQSTAMSFLSLYRDPIIAMNTAVSDFKVADLMNSDMPVDLFLVIRQPDKNRTRPLTRLLIAQFLNRATASMEFEGGRSVAGYKHRLLMLLDEFPQLGKLEILEEALSFMAGFGIKAFLIAQDLSQIYKAYTKDESVISNCHIRIAFAPNKIETAELLSKYTGVTTIRKAQRSYSGSRLVPFLAHVMAAEQETQRQLLTPDECMRLPAALKSADGTQILEPGDMLILPAGAPPIYGKQILYFKDPIFSGRSKIPAPAQSDRLRAVSVKPRAIVPLEDTAPAPASEAPAALPVAAAAVAATVVASATAAPIAPPMAEPQAVQYTAEELAQLDAEAESGADPAVEAAMMAEGMAAKGGEASITAPANVQAELALEEPPAGHEDQPEPGAVVAAPATVELPAAASAQTGEQSDLLDFEF